MEPLAIPRIQLSDSAAFDRDYLQPLMPVVIKDLFAGDPIRSITTAAEARAAWGQETIDLRDEYDAAIRIAQVRNQLRVRDGTWGVPPWPEPVGDQLTLTEYLDLVEKSHGTFKPRIHFEPPPSIRDALSVPDVCLPKAGESSEITMGCFIGVERSFSHLHFDKDGTHGLLYQVYGRKRVVILPSHAAPKLAPLTQYAGVCLQNFTDDDRRGFLHFVGGQEAVIEPGDAVYLPAMSWHFVDYLTPCFGINLRFRRSQVVSELLNHLYPDMHTQTLCASLSDPAKARIGQEVLAEIELEAARARREGRPIAPLLREVVMRWNKRLYPDMPLAAYTLDIEAHFPSPLPNFIDPADPVRPRYH